MPMSNHNCYDRTGTLDTIYNVYYTFAKANRIVTFRNESIITNASLTYRAVFVKKEEKEDFSKKRGGKEDL